MWTWRITTGLALVLAASCASTQVTPRNPDGGAEALVERAEAALDAGDFASAMRLAMEARGQPLSLDDTRVSRRIDRAIERVSAGSGEKIDRWLAGGRFLDALDLADALAKVNPSQAAEAKRVESQAATHFQRTAKRALDGGLLGVAALSFALARRAGYPATEFDDVWRRFQSSNCYAEPAISFEEPGVATDEARARFSAILIQEVRALRSRCGAGTQPLLVRVWPAMLESVDRSLDEVGGVSAPGYRFELERPVSEQIGYEIEEKVTRMKAVTEEVERRDCAPRPGKSGCEVWTEEVTKEVPVQEFTRTRKTKTLSWPRSVANEVGGDNVIRFPAKRVERRVVYLGRFALNDGPGVGHFDVAEVDSDQGHGEVREGGVSLAADPLQARSLAALFAAADQSLLAQVRTGVEGAVADALAPSLKEAASLARDGDLLGAEDRYLRALVLGGPVTVAMERFFDGRYGQNTASVIAPLLSALGRVENRTQTELFPTLNNEEDDGQQ
ncbi:MAG: hypothetical protein AAF654_01415 [Myxococcota bacterium]